MSGNSFKKSKEVKNFQKSTQKLEELKKRKIEFEKKLESMLEKKEKETNEQLQKIHRLFDDEVGKYGSVALDLILFASKDSREREREREREQNNRLRGS